MTNRVRFSIDKQENIDSEYCDIPIPQLKSVVFLHNEQFVVKGITYGYIRGIENYNLIDIRVEYMEDEDYADFN